MSDTKRINGVIGVTVGYDWIKLEFESHEITIDKLKIYNQPFNSQKSEIADIIRGNEEVKRLNLLAYQEQKEEIERMKLQIRRAHLSLSWCNTESQIPNAIHHLEKAVPPVPESPEYLEAARIFLQEGDK